MNKYSSHVNILLYIYLCINIILVCGISLIMLGIIFDNYCPDSSSMILATGIFILVMWIIIILFSIFCFVSYNNLKLLISYITILLFIYYFVSIILSYITIYSTYNDLTESCNKYKNDMLTFILTIIAILNIITIFMLLNTYNIITSIIIYY
jgi:hypothetical protein